VRPVSSEYITKAFGKFVWFMSTVTRPERESPVRKAGVLRSDEGGRWFAPKLISNAAGASNAIHHFRMLESYRAMHENQHHHSSEFGSPRSSAVQ
jgi:hypothetical protein